MSNSDKNVLEKIIESTKRRVVLKKSKIPIGEIKTMAEYRRGEDFIFERALSEKGFHFICEIKKASPSKGVISEEFPYLKIAKEYQEAGASAISCLTEPYYFLGSDDYLKEIKEFVKLPILRKDFIIDEYMIYEAKAIGADAVLLIAAALERERLKDYFSIADGLGLSVLMETHDEKEIEKALYCKPRALGVNNRDLKTFKVDTNRSLRLKKLIPKDIIFVSESGINSREDILNLEKNGINAVLIGERLMKSRDKAKTLNDLRGISE